MTNQNIIAKFDSFIVVKDGGSEHEYIRIKSDSGNWSLAFRDDNPMFGAWLKMCSEDEYKNALETTTVLEYTFTHTFFDKLFVDDVLNAFESLKARRVAASRVPTEEEESEAIKEAEVMEELRKRAE